MKNKRIIMNKEFEFLPKFLSFTVLVALSLYNAYEVIQKLFPNAITAGLYYIGTMAVAALIPVLLFTLYKHYHEEGKIYLSRYDLYRISKFVLLALSVISGNMIPVVAVLLIEHMDKIIPESIIGQYTSKLSEVLDNDDIEDRSVFKSFIIYFGVIPITIIITTASVLGLNDLLRVEIKKATSGKSFLTALRQLPYWYSSLGLLLAGAYLVSGSIKGLFTLPTKSENKSKYSNLYRNLLWMAIAFTLASPTLLYPIAIYGWYPCALFVYESFTSLQGLLFILTQLSLYFIQPMVEEIVFRALLFRYFVFEGLCKKDYKEMNLKEKILYALYNGVIFALVHQNVRGYTSIYFFIPLFTAGVLASMLTFLSGRIDLATYEHTFHNLSCTFSKHFIQYWYRTNRELVRVVIAPLCSATTKLSVVTGLESLYKRAFPDTNEQSLDSTVIANV